MQASCLSQSAGITVVYHHAPQTRLILFFYSNLMGLELETLPLALFL
jgi:hypothetical protein